MIAKSNHFHCILENVVVGADTNTNTDVSETEKTHKTRHEQIVNEHIGSSLCRVVQWFKTMTTNEYMRGVKTLGWQPLHGKLWQRNYYEQGLRNISSTIRQNGQPINVNSSPQGLIKDNKTPLSNFPANITQLNT